MTELQFPGSCGRARGLGVYPWLPTSRVAAPLTTTPASSIPPVKHILGQQSKQYLSNPSNYVRLPVSSEVKSHLRLLQGRCRTQRKVSSPIFFHSPAVCSSTCFKRQDSVLLWSETLFYFSTCWSLVESSPHNEEIRGICVINKWNTSDSIIAAMFIFG